MCDRARETTATGVLTRQLEFDRQAPSRKPRGVILASGMNLVIQKATSSQRREPNNNTLQSPLYLCISLKGHPSYRTDAMLEDEMLA